jgi:hypothetical protein
MRRPFEAHWARVGLHAERGPVSFRLLTETMAGHDRAHLQQLTQTIAALERLPQIALGTVIGSAISSCSPRRLVSPCSSCR